MLSNACRCQSLSVVEDDIDGAYRTVFTVKFAEAVFFPSLI